ncbi:MAG TPA: hypothetical protein VKA70_06540 [Blastocatellia bacterium]|nr:hypothetical protein [Blastocatellia bacterium]
MIDVKEAVKIAIGYLKQLYEPAQLHDILLEEVALSDDEKYWYVTLGFSRPVASTNPVQALKETILKSQNIVDHTKYQREYKVFQIDAATGQVRSMKIRAA